MDPNTILANIRAIVIELRRTADSRTVCQLADELGEFVNDLDICITLSGVLPADWEKARVTAQPLNHDTRTNR